MFLKSIIIISFVAFITTSCNQQEFQRINELIPLVNTTKESDIEFKSNPFSDTTQKTEVDTYNNWNKEVRDTIAFQVTPSPSSEKISNSIQGKWLKAKGNRSIQIKTGETINFGIYDQALTSDIEAENVVKIGTYKISKKPSSTKAIKINTAIIDKKDTGFTETGVITLALLAKENKSSGKDSVSFSDLKKSSILNKIKKLKSSEDAITSIEREVKKQLGKTLATTRTKINIVEVKKEVATIEENTTGLNWSSLSRAWKKAISKNVPTIDPNSRSLTNSQKTAILNLKTLTYVCLRYRYCSDSEKIIQI